MGAVLTTIGAKKRSGGGNGNKENEDNTVVLKHAIHCDGCTHKIFKVLRRFKGVVSVEKVKTDGDAGKIRVTGKVDPTKLIDTLVKRGVKRKVEILSPQPKNKDAKPNNKSENKKTKDKKFFLTSTSKFLIHPLLWRLTGFVSSIVGFTCYAFSSSFQNMFGQWSQVKIIVYSVVTSLLCISMLLVKRCSGRHGRSLLLKAQLGFVVLTLTSLWSFLQDRSEEGKVVNSYSKRMNLTSTGAFALMAISLSRQLQLGLDVGVTNFFVGCFLVAVMKVNVKLAPLAAFFCYLLANIRFISDFLLKFRAHEPCFDPLKFYEKFPEGEKYMHRDEMIRKIVHTHLISLCISLLLEISNKHSTQHANDDKVGKKLMHHGANSEIYIDMPKFQGPEANSDDVLARDTKKVNSDVFVQDTDEAKFQDLEAYSDDFAHDTVADRKNFINKESEKSKESK